MYPQHVFVLVIFCIVSMVILTKHYVVSLQGNWCVTVFLRAFESRVRSHGRVILGGTGQLADKIADKALSQAYGCWRVCGWWCETLSKGVVAVEALQASLCLHGLCLFGERGPFTCLPVDITNYMYVH